MRVTDPFSVAFIVLQQLIDQEFAPEGIQLQPDMLHDSLGHEKAICGCAPVGETPMPGQMLVQDTLVEVKYLDKFDLEIDPKQSVDPRIITNKAERMRRAVKSHTLTYPGTDQVWFFDVLSTVYPNDPTGNKTRFVMQLRFRGNNAALVETTG